MKHYTTSFSESQVLFLRFQKVARKTYVTPPDLSNFRLSLLSYAGSGARFENGTAMPGLTLRAGLPFAVRCSLVETAKARTLVSMQARTVDR